MEAIREIRSIDSDEIVIKLPEGFKKRLVEIIVLPVDESSEKKQRFSGFLNNPIRIEGFKLPSREERNER